MAKIIDLFPTRSTIQTKASVWASPERFDVRISCDQPQQKRQFVSSQVSGSTLNDSNQNTRQSHSHGCDCADFESFSRKKASHKVDTARVFISQAARLLDGLGETERQVAWLLEDCAELLSEQERGSTQAKN